MLVRLDGSSDIPRRHNFVATICFSGYYILSANLANEDWVLSKNKFI